MSASASYASGDGPGDITPDGCAVDLYALLPPGLREAGLIAAAFTPPASLLELGCGTGRVTRCLVASGFDVVAVDESAGMLARVDCASTVCSTIEALRLPDRFDVVLLASHLINVPDDSAAVALLESCARHVTTSGSVVIERRAPSWFASVAEFSADRDGIHYHLYDIHRSAEDVVTATISYEVGGRSWRQTFTTKNRNDSDIAGLLERAGLRLEQYLDDDHAWLLARPSDSR